MKKTYDFVVFHHFVKIIYKSVLKNPFLDFIGKVADGETERVDNVIWIVGPPLTLFLACNRTKKELKKQTQ